jgi:hypothetical protein
LLKIISGGWQRMGARTRNTALDAVISETGRSQDRLAARFCLVAAENGEEDLTRVTRSHVSQWLRGVRPSGRAPRILCETLSRELGRTVTPAEIGLSSEPTTSAPAWDVDTSTALADLGATDLDIERRHLLANSAFSVAGLALPSEGWWQQRLQRTRARTSGALRTVTARDVEDVREMTAFFSRRDQQRGGQAGRAALIAYLRTEIADYVRSPAASDAVRCDLMSASGELVYLAGWTAFDASEHGLAQSYFRLALQLAADADEGPLAGHILRAMAHQAVDLGHPREALDLAAASLASNRYARAVPRERALLGIVHARALAAAGRKQQALEALGQAEGDLTEAADRENEPGRVFFFGEASLAHETACTLRDLGDLAAAERQFHHSVRTRLATPFARTHAVTLGYLGGLQASRGHLDAAIHTWNSALDTMDGVHSGRARDAVVRMTRALSPLRQRGGTAAADLDERARMVLRTVR